MIKFNTSGNFSTYNIQLFKILFPFFFLFGKEVYAQELHIKDLGWLEGAWQGELFGNKGVETWSGPQGNSMAGFFKMYNQTEDTTIIFELLTIVQETNSVIYRFKHFSTNFEAWEETPLTYSLTSLVNKKAVFEMKGVVYGKPKVLEYELVDANNLQITIRTPVKGQKDLKTTVTVFTKKPSRDGITSK